MHLRPALLLTAITLMPTTQNPSEHGQAPVRAPLPGPEEIAELPPDGGPEFNRLVFSSSPYLLQHARNPVDWYPWGEEAFARAKAEGKPVFLSIGYSTCHWCHVMEHESFEDEEVAALLNAGFVCIKVDREERPDLDGIYMAVTQAMTGRGGWPMTVIMTPEKKPWFAGTYFPKDGGAGRGGMMQLLPELTTAWRDQRAAIETTAENAVNWLEENSKGRPGEAPRAGALARARESLGERYDAERGGFGSAPKFPTPHNLRLLLRDWKRTGDARSLEMVVHTLREMRKGGIWDHVGFGFHRYSTDAEWLLPHFEKMLYDQALMAMALVEAWQASGHDDLRRTAEEVFAYVLRDMTSPEGAFYSAEDADSEGEEGLFYVWTPEELRAVLGDGDGAFAIELFNVVEGGNFKDQSTQLRTGDSILHLTEDLDAVAARLGTSRAELDARIESVRARLFEVRERRIHPLKDDKVLADWNGLMIAALALGGRAFDEPRYVDAAARAADFLLEHLRGEDGRLLKRWRGGQAGLDGVLEDHAYVTWGLLELYEASGEARWLRAALETNAQLALHFADPEGGGFFAGPADADDLIVRLKESYDGALPAGNSVAALNLVRLARMTGDTELEESARGVLAAFGRDLRERPAASTQMLAALDFLVGPSFELVVAGDPAAEDTRAALAAVHRVFAPNKVVVQRPNGAAAEELAELVPYARDQAPREGRVTFYLCREFTCEAPTNDVEHVLSELSAVGSQASTPPDDAGGR